jgi:hypothetical protein
MIPLHLPYESLERRHALCKSDFLDLKFLVDLATHDHESAEELYQLPFSFLCAEQWEMLLRLSLNRMRVMIQFLEMLPSILLSFHEPSDE